MNRKYGHGTLLTLYGIKSTMHSPFFRLRSMNNSGSSILSARCIVAVCSYSQNWYGSSYLPKFLFIFVVSLGFIVTDIALLAFVHTTLYFGPRISGFSCKYPFGTLFVAVCREFLEKDQRAPVGMVLLHTSDTCFIQTDQLDGETDWRLCVFQKPRRELDAKIYGEYFDSLAFVYMLELSQ
jgi:hypothetical protein